MKVKINSPPPIKRGLNQRILHLWFKFGDTSWNLSSTGDVLWCIQTQNGWIFNCKLNGTLMVTFKHPPNYKGFFTKYFAPLGDPELNGSQVIARTSWWLTDGRTNTERRRRRQYPKAKTGNLHNCVTRTAISIISIVIWYICNQIYQFSVGSAAQFVTAINKPPCVPRLIIMCTQSMMTSSNGNIFRVTGPLCGEFTGHRGIPRTKASDAGLWCFLWSAPE